MSYQVVVTPEARIQLYAIFDYIATAASPDIARRFTTAILDHIASFADFPLRGTPRDDIRPGLRTTAWRRRVTMAYAVEGETVVFVGIFYSGQDFEALLADI